MNDLIDRQAAIDAIMGEPTDAHYPSWYAERLEQLPSAQPEQRYTEEELRVFQYGISLRLLSKRSSQHWHYDEDTATEIEFLERLYDKVGADIRGEQDDESRSNSNAQTDTRARGMGATDKSSGI